MADAFLPSARIFVAGHRGLVGSAIVRRLRREGFGNLLLRSRDEVDLTDQAQVDRFFSEHKPEFVFLAAAKVGGIQANSSYPAEFIRDNLALQTNIIHSAWKHGTRKLLFLGSSCIYPRDCPQPIREEYLLTGPLEASNQWYAIAKIAGLKMCQAYREQYGFDAISAMPTNLYGPNDNYHPKDSHVIPGLMRRIDAARENGESHVVVWGSGTPMREFMYVEDLCDALIHLMRHDSCHDLINVGSGFEVSIRVLAQTIADVVGYRGNLLFDTSKPDGTPRKRLDIERLREMGWTSRTTLNQGLIETYAAYRARLAP